MMQRAAWWRNGGWRQLPVPDGGVHAPAVQRAAWGRNAGWRQLPVPDGGVHAPAVQRAAWGRNAGWRQLPVPGTGLPALASACKQPHSVLLATRPHVPCAQITALKNLDLNIRRAKLSKDGGSNVNTYFITGVCGVRGSGGGRGG